MINLLNENHENQSVALIIYDLLKSQGLQQKELAAVIGCSPKQLCFWLAGKSQPSLKYYRKIEALYKKQNG
ncbi:MAG: helix-turn-helix domain-containing protein [Firmicutes bacterium]|nr:helix-turn-helix domain-containing protein [Bacillota bacterium]